MNEEPTPLIRAANGRMISSAQPPELYVATKSSAYFIVDGEIMGCPVDSSGRPMWDELFRTLPPDVDKSLMVAILQFLTGFLRLGALRNHGPRKPRAGRSVSLRAGCCLPEGARRGLVSLRAPVGRSARRLPHLGQQHAGGR